MAVIHEKDPGVARLGGEPSRPLALSSMRRSATSLFCSPPPPPSWEPRRLASWHSALGAATPSPHLQLVAAPLTIVYQEGTSIGPGLASSYAAITTVTLGKVSVVEVVSPAPDTAQEVVALLSFAHNPETDKKKSADVKIVYKDTLDSTTPMASLTVSLAPCTVTLDPGLVDRTYLLLHYSELDPDCVHGTPSSSAPPSPASLVVTVSCPSVGLNFFTPKPDMREERDLVASLYTRAVHPEVAIIQLVDLVLKVSTEGGLRSASYFFGSSHLPQPL